MREVCWKSGICAEHGHRLAMGDTAGACPDCPTREEAKPLPKISEGALGIYCPHCGKARGHEPNCILSQPTIDAYQTAKPGEPVWTVQGGDPLGPPTLLFWAFLARVRAGVRSFDNLKFLEKVDELLGAGTTVDEDSAEQLELLRRATSTELVAWEMQAYQRGDVAAEITVISSGEVVEQKVDIWDVRRKIESACANAEAALGEADILLEGFLGEPLGHVPNLGTLLNRVQINLRALRKLAHVPRPGERLGD